MILKFDIRPSKWEPMPPSTATGLTDHVWTIEEFTLTVVVPEENNT